MANGGWQSDLAIDAEGLGRRYGRRWAIADVSLRVPAGSVTMVTGANGSGKSTLFRVLSTAIRADRGRASILGFDLVKGREDVRKASALLSHHNYLYEALTARENLAVIADHLGVSWKSIDGILDRVGLTSRADDLVSTFSAGMRQRVAFARVLLQQPRIAFLDEPYAQLDPAGFDLVDSVVRDLKSHGVTVLMATHHLERSEAMSDFVLTLESGQLKSFGARG